MPTKAIVRVWPFDERRQAFDRRARAALATSPRWGAAGIAGAVAMAAADVAEPVGWGVKGAQLTVLAAAVAAAAAGRRRVARRLARAGDAEAGPGPVGDDTSGSPAVLPIDTRLPVTRR